MTCSDDRYVFDFQGCHQGRHRFLIFFLFFISLFPYHNGNKKKKRYTQNGVRVTGMTGGDGLNPIYP